MVLEDFGLDLAAWLAKNPRPKHGRHTLSTCSSWTSISCSSKTQATTVMSMSLNAHSCVQS